MNILRFTFYILHFVLLWFCCYYITNWWRCKESKWNRSRSSERPFKIFLNSIIAFQHFKRSGANRTKKKQRKQAEHSSQYNIIIFASNLVVCTIMDWHAFTSISIRYIYVLIDCRSIFSRRSVKNKRIENYCWIDISLFSVPYDLAWNINEHSKNCTQNKWERKKEFEM